MFEQRRYPGDRGGTEQQVPVNMFITESDDLVVTAPMPGLEADDLDITVHDRSLTIAGQMRGPGQENRRYVVHEWTYGPYRRVIELPFAVDAANANASLGNGVLALSLPRAASARAHRIQLKQTAADRAEAHGHSGHTTTSAGSSEASEST